MGISLEQLAADTARVTIPIGSQELHVEYVPSAVTEEALAAMTMFQSGQSDPGAIMEGFASFNETLVSLIKDWDLYEDKAQTRKVPITAKRLRGVQLSLRMAILMGIIGDIRPEAFTGQTTVSGLTQTL